MAIVYKLRPGFAFAGGTVGYGTFGLMFDVGAALTAGGGQFTVTDATLAAKLDTYAPVFRFSDDGVTLKSFDVRFKSLSVGGLLATSDSAFEVHRDGENFARLKILSAGTVLTGDGTIEPATSLGGASSIPATIVDVKGDLIAASAADTVVRVPVGTVGQILASNPSATGGIKWIAETQINLLAYGLPTDGVSDCTAAVLAAKAANPGGGCLVWPDGTYRVSTAQDHSDAHWNMTGQGEDTTILQAPVDANNALFVLNRTECEIRDLSIYGPSAVTVAGVGSAPLRRGLILRDRNNMKHVRISGFGYGVVFDGNHQAIYDSKITDCKYNLAWAQGLAGYTTTQAASFTHGNQTMVNVDLTGAGDSSIYIAGDSKVDSSSFTQVHTGFAQYGITAAIKGTQEAAITNSSFYDCSFESPGSGYIRDLGHDSTNRRLWKAIKWYNPLTGPFDPTYAVSSAASGEMCKLGMMFDWEIFGRNGDTSNTSFGHVGTAVGGCGFRADQFNNVIFHNADQLWSSAAGAAKSMFVLSASAIGCQNVWVTVFTQYVVAIMKSSAGLTDEKFVCESGTGDPNYQFHAGVKPADGSAVALGRAAGAGPLTSGALCPIVTRGSQNSSYVTGTVAVGDQLTVDTAAAGSLKTATTVAQHIVAIATTASSGGRASTIIHTKYDYAS
jgi:hypothetical protein